ELKARLEEYKAAYLREGRPYLIAVLLPFLAGGLAVWPFATYVEPSLRSAALLWLAAPLFLVLWLSPFILYLHYLSRWNSRLRQSHGLVCRWCEAPLKVAQWKIAPTGRCGACGQPIWAEPA